MWISVKNMDALLLILFIRSMIWALLMILLIDLGDMQKQKNNKKGRMKGKEKKKKTF